MSSTSSADRSDPGRTYFLRRPYLLLAALPVALALAPGLILLPALQNGDYASDRLGVFIFLLVASFAMCDLAAWIVLAALSVRLVVSSRGVIFYGIGYAIQSTWLNLDHVQTAADGTAAGLVLRQAGMDPLGFLGALSVLLPLLSWLAPRRLRPIPAPRIDTRLISLTPFASDQLQADISRYAPAAAASPAGSEPVTANVASATAAASAARAAEGQAGPVAARPNPPWRLAVLAVGLAAVLLAEVALGRSLLQRWQGAPPWRTLKVDSWVEGVAFSSDGQYLTVATSRSTVQLWRLSDGALLQTLPVTASIASFAQSADGLTLAIGSDNGAVTLWAAGWGGLLHRLAGHQDRVNSVAFSPDGQTLASASKDGTVRLWRVADGALLHTLRAEDSNAGLQAVNGVAFSPDGQRLVVAADSFQQTVQLWSVAGGTLLEAYAGNTLAESAAFAPDGQSLVVATFDQGLWVMSAGKLAVLRTLTGSDASSQFDEWMAAVAPDGQRLASVTNGGLLQEWRLSDGALLQTRRAHTRPVRVVAFSPDSGYVATGSLDDTARVWAVPPP